MREYLSSVRPRKSIFKLQGDEKFAILSLPSMNPSATKEVEVNNNFQEENFATATKNQHVIRLPTFSEIELPKGYKKVYESRKFPESLVHESSHFYDKLSKENRDFMNIYDYDADNEDVTFLGKLPFDFNIDCLEVLFSIWIKQAPITQKQAIELAKNNLKRKHSYSVATLKIVYTYFRTRHFQVYDENIRKDIFQKKDRKKEPVLTRGSRERKVKEEINVYQESLERKKNLERIRKICSSFVDDRNHQMAIVQRSFDLLKAKYEGIKI